MTKNPTGWSSTVTKWPKNDCDGWAAYDYEEELTDKYLIRRSPIYTYYNVLNRLGNWRSELRGTHSTEMEIPGMVSPPAEG